MEAISVYIIKVIIVSAVLFAYYYFVLRNKNFHGYNRFYLLSVVALSVSLPFIKLGFSIPEHSSTVVYLFQTDFVSEAPVVKKSSAFLFGWQQALVIIYSLVVILLLAFFTRSILRLHQMRLRGTVTEMGEYRLIKTDSKGTPFSFFKNIFWDRRADVHSAESQKMMQHELVHVRQKHSADKLAINLVQIFFWFNPIFWLIKKELSMIHEFLADREAFEEGDAKAFSLIALRAAFPGHGWPANNPFFYSPVKRRLMMILKNKKKEMNYFGRVLALPIAVLLIIFIAPKATANQFSENEILNEIVVGAVQDTIPTPPQVPAPPDAPDTPPIVKESPSGLLIFGGTQSGQPLYFVDGKPVSQAEVAGMETTRIVSVKVLKGKSAEDKYGEKGRNGVVEVRTVEAGDTTKSKSPRVLLRGLRSTDSSPFYVVDGKVVGNLDDIVTNADEIGSISVLKGENATKKYGPRAKNGVIEIRTKSDTSRVIVVEGHATVGKVDTGRKVGTRENVVVYGYRTGKADTVSADLEAARNAMEVARLQMEASRNEIEKARLELEKSRGEIERSKIEIERSKAELEKSKVEIERAKKELERERKRIEREQKKR